MKSPNLFKWIDLTHELSEGIPTWEGESGFHVSTHLYEDPSRECQFAVQTIDMFAGIGTHMDAPAHCIPEGKTIDQIPLQSLISPCVVIDVSKKAHEDYSIDMQDLHDFESGHGKIHKGTFVIFHTGWEKYWSQPVRYRNNHRFPCVSKDVAEYLVTRDISGLGIDTLSPDRGDEGFPVHQVVLGAGKYIVENIANALQMPPTGGYLCVMPIKISGGTEAPIRLVGIAL